MSNAIIAENLTKKFGDVAAVNGISFAIKEGECFGFLGPNGAGKTCVLNCINGFYKPQKGDIYFETVKSLLESFGLENNFIEAPDYDGVFNLVEKRLADAGEIIGIKVLDHVIIGYSNYVSMMEKGYIKKGA